MSEHESDSILNAIDFCEVCGRKKNHSRRPRLINDGRLVCTQCINKHNLDDREVGTWDQAAMNRLARIQDRLEVESPLRRIR